MTTSQHDAGPASSKQRSKVRQTDRQTDRQVSCRCESHMIQPDWFVLINPISRNTTRSEEKKEVAPLPRLLSHRAAFRTWWKIGNSIFLLEKTFLWWASSITAFNRPIRAERDELMFVCGAAMIRPIITSLIYRNLISDCFYNLYVFKQNEPSPGAAAVLAATPDRSHVVGTKQDIWWCHFGLQWHAVLTERRRFTVTQSTFYGTTFSGDRKHYDVRGLTSSRDVSCIPNIRTLHCSSVRWPWGCDVTTNTTSKLKSAVVFKRFELTRPPQPITSDFT